jgi:hypothetical protein
MISVSIQAFVVIKISHFTDDNSLLLPLKVFSLQRKQEVRKDRSPKERKKAVADFDRLERTIFRTFGLSAS